MLFWFRQTQSKFKRFSSQRYFKKVPCHRGRDPLRKYCSPCRSIRLLSWRTSGSRWSVTVGGSIGAVGVSHKTLKAGRRTKDICFGSKFSCRPVNWRLAWRRRCNYFVAASRDATHARNLTVGNKGEPGTIQPAPVSTAGFSWINVAAFLGKTKILLQGKMPLTLQCRKNLPDRLSTLTSQFTIYLAVYSPEKKQKSFFTSLKRSRNPSLFLERVYPNQLSSFTAA